MYRLDREEFSKYSFILLWVVLAFQAGFLNAFGFIACGRYVSHVTGFGTQIGIAVAQQNISFALELLGFPLTFIFGSWLNGVLTSSRIDRGLRPRYEIAMVLQSLIILFLIVVGRKGLFGHFGEELMDVRDFVLLFALALVCGLQNGCITTLTKGQIRTTHLTGVSTDLGTDLARLMFGRLSAAESSHNIRSNITRFATICAFAFGSIFSVIETRRLEYTALWMPFITSVVVFGVMKRIGYQLDKVHGQKHSMNRVENGSLIYTNQN